GDLAQRMGLMEVKSFVLTDPDLLALFSNPAIQTGNAKSRTYSATRTTLQAGLLDILSRNINAPKPINIYETGEVLRINASKVIEETCCWGFASLDARASFTWAKSYVQTLLKALNIDYTLIPCEAQHYIVGRAATVIIDGKAAGQFGEIITVAASLLVSRTRLRWGVGLWCADVLRFTSGVARISRGLRLMV
ncbi:MAG: hypothetical protein AAFZ49_13115, partial [Cyanobacteria bacterium J06659_2]